MDLFKLIAMEKREQSEFRFKQLVNLMCSHKGTEIRRKNKIRKLKRGKR